MPLKGTDVVLSGLVGLVTAGPVGGLLSPISLSFFCRKVEQETDGDKNRAWGYWAAMGVIAAPMAAFSQMVLLAGLSAPQVTPEAVIAEAEVSTVAMTNDSRSTDIQDSDSYRWEPLIQGKSLSLREQYRNSLIVARVVGYEEVNEVVESTSDQEIRAIAGFGCFVKEAMFAGKITRAQGRALYVEAASEFGINADLANRIADAAIYMAEVGQCVPVAADN